MEYESGCAIYIPHYQRPALHVSQIIVPFVTHECRQCVGPSSSSSAFAELKKENDSSSKRTFGLVEVGDTQLLPMTVMMTQ